MKLFSIGSAILAFIFAGLNLIGIHQPTKVIPITTPAPKITSAVTPIISPNTSSVKLFLNKKTNIPNTQLKATLTSVVPNKQNVPDWLTAAVVLMEDAQTNTKKELIYQVGGIAGFMQTEQEAFGIKFSVIDFYEDSIVLSY